ncbi:MAG: fibrobacter succinogenes major paralogous domain-containing protein [Bacteroidales bacterium]
MFVPLVTYVVAFYLFTGCRREEDQPVKRISISIISEPTKVIYYSGEQLDLTGLVVSIGTDDGKNEALPFSRFAANGIKSVPAHGEPVFDSIVIISDSVTGVGTQVQISVSMLVTTMEINTTPLKTDYLVGERLDFSGMVMELTMDNGSRKEVNSLNFAENGISSSPSEGTMVDLSMNAINFSHVLSGSDRTVAIAVEDKVVDIEGNVYSYIKIGEQLWMGEDLLVTKYADGTVLRDYSNDVSWSNLGAGNTWEDAGYSRYDFGTKDQRVYYTWAAAMGATVHKPAIGIDSLPVRVQGVCPAGWHLPSDQEWKQLEMYLGMSPSDADILGVTRGTEEGSMLAGDRNRWVDGHMDSSMVFGTSGFNGLPNGYRANNGFMFYSYDLGTWWSSTQVSDEYAIFRSVHYLTSFIRRRSYSKSTGFCVRCIRN